MPSGLWFLSRKLITLPLFSVPPFYAFDSGTSGNPHTSWTLAGTFKIVVSANTRLIPARLSHLLWHIRRSSNLVIRLRNISTSAFKSSTQIWSSFISTYRLSFTFNLLRQYSYIYILLPHCYRYTVSGCLISCEGTATAIALFYTSLQFWRTY